MKSEKKYLRNKIVYNFVTDFCNIINRFIILNLNRITDDTIIKTHKLK
jgi:hypothetical protein